VSTGAEPAVAPARPEPAGFAKPDPWRSMRALALRECRRVTRLWTQTILAPVVSSALFILVFGLSLGSRIKEINGFEYDVFIVPGLIAMAMAQAAFSNNSSSLLQARNDRYINDVLASPMHPWQMNVGYMIGGIFRAGAIGIALVAIALPLTGVPIENPGQLLIAAALMVVLFAALGVVVGIHAQTFDHHSFINNILILPLTFLGGVFYSIEILPSPWQEISHANPIFYMVDSIRYGFLGAGDVHVGLALGFTAIVAIAMVAWAQWLFTTGRKLKP
jgi:ABC-2 type transport system permease protein